MIGIKREYIINLLLSLKMPGTSNVEIFQGNTLTFKLYEF